MEFHRKILSLSSIYRSFMTEILFIKDVRLEVIHPYIHSSIRACFPTISTKGNSFCDFLFASMDVTSFLRRKELAKGANSFL